MLEAYMLNDGYVLDIHNLADNEAIQCLFIMLEVYLLNDEYVLDIHNLTNTRAIQCFVTPIYGCLSTYETFNPSGVEILKSPWLMMKISAIHHEIIEKVPVWGKRK